MNESGRLCKGRAAGPASMKCRGWGNEYSPARDFLRWWRPSPNSWEKVTARASKSQIEATSEELLAAALSALDEGISIEGPDLRIIYANEAYRKIFGDDVTGMACYEVYERWSGHRQECPVRESMGTHAPSRIYCEKDAAGRRVTLEIVAAPVSDDAGRVIAGVEAVRDITELVEAREQVQKKSAEVSRLAEVAREISTNLDLDTALGNVVKSAATLVGADSGTVALLDSERRRIFYPYHFNMPAELAGLSMPEGAGLAGKIIVTSRPLIVNDYPAHPAHIPEFAAAGVKALLGVPLMVGKRPVGALGLFRKQPEQPFSTEEVEVIMAIAEQAAIAIDNARLYSELSRTARQLETRVRERTDALSRMYRESERRGQALAEANDQLRQSGRLKNEFLANVSHELRTPITSVIGFSRLILDGYDGKISAEQRQDLGIVLANAEELLRLINDLLDLSRIEAGRVDLLLKEAEPGPLVEEVVTSMSSQAVQKGLKLKSRLAETLRPVKMDRGKIRQVLVNLVSNAIRYTNEGEVIVSCRQTAGETLFEVADTGVGLTPKQAAQVFDRFYQASTEPDGGGGMGLGLAISRRLVEMHGGHIRVESSYGEGSTFSFTIPGGLK